MDREPKTREELLACEEKPMFTETTIVCDTPELVAKYRVPCLGDIIHLPVCERGYVTPISSDSIMFVTDGVGQEWRPVKQAGKWYKQRIIL